MEKELEKSSEPSDQLASRQIKNIRGKSDKPDVPSPNSESNGGSSKGTFSHAGRGHGDEWIRSVAQGYHGETDEEYNWDFSESEVREQRVFDRRQQMREWLDGTDRPRLLWAF